MADCAAYAGPIALQALTGKGAGHTVGLFRQGWYLDCGGSILLLHDAQWGGIPFGVGIPDFAGRFSRDVRDLQTPVSWQDGRLFIPAAGQTLGLSPAPVETLPPAAPLRTQALRLAESAGKGCLYRLLPYMQALLAGEYPRDAFPAGAPEDVFSQRLSRLFRALGQSDARPLETALRSLIGFGPGLTPSGDDFLTGFLYALLRLSGPPGPAALLCGQVKALAGQYTSRISAAYLTVAASGGVFTLFDRAMHSADGCMQLLQAGHSSGADILTGLLFGWAYARD